MHTDPVVLSVWDKDTIASDDMIGDVTLDVEHILTSIGAGNTAGTTSKSNVHTQWYQLHEDAARATPITGEVLLQITAVERREFRADIAGNLSINSNTAIEKLGGGGGFFELVDQDGEVILGKDANSGQYTPSVVHVQVISSWVLPS